MGTSHLLDLQGLAPFQSLNEYGWTILSLNCPGILASPTNHNLLSLCYQCLLEYIQQNLFQELVFIQVSKAWAIRLAL